MYDSDIYIEREREALAALFPLHPPICTVMIMNNSIIGGNSYTHLWEYSTPHWEVQPVVVITFLHHLL